MSKGPYTDEYLWGMAQQCYGEADRKRAFADWLKEREEKWEDEEERKKRKEKEKER